MVASSTLCFQSSLNTLARAPRAASAHKDTHHCHNFKYSDCVPRHELKQTYLNVNIVKELVENLNTWILLGVSIKTPKCCVGRTGQSGVVWLLLSCSELASSWRRESVPQSFTCRFSIRTLVDVFNIHDHLCVLPPASSQWTHQVWKV